MGNNVLVFMREELLEPAGGPAAICYYYSIEQKKRGEHYFEFLACNESNASLHEKEKILERMPKFIRVIYSDLKSIYKTILLLKGNYPVPSIDFDKYGIIHFHDALSLYLYKNQLANYRGKIILQSHTPQPQRQELIENLPEIQKRLFSNLDKKFEKIDKEAFERADYVVFPCPEAEEPYYNNWPYYKVIHDNKKDKYRYVLSGIPASNAKRSRKEIRNELGISDTDFMISYVGRHNIVKGYDSLKRIGDTILKQHKDTWVICAGKEAPLTGLEASRWVELGWTSDAYSYISASDVFILPNKETYFDIVMLEILSLGKVVIASRTGGNKYFERNKCEGVLLYDTEEEAVELINKVRLMSSEEKDTLGQKNKAFYMRYHTVSAMYDSYVAMLREISTTL